MDKPDQQFVIRMANGWFYERMIGTNPVTTSDIEKAFHFKSKKAAFEVVGTTSQFHMSAILPYDPPQSQPGAQGAIRAHREGE